MKYIYDKYGRQVGKIEDPEEELEQFQRKMDRLNKEVDRQNQKWAEKENKRGNDAVGDSWSVIIVTILLAIAVIGWKYLGSEIEPWQGGGADLLRFIGDIFGNIGAVIDLFLWILLGAIALAVLFALIGGAIYFISTLREFDIRARIIISFFGGILAGIIVGILILAADLMTGIYIHDGGISLGVFLAPILYIIITLLNAFFGVSFLGVPFEVSDFSTVLPYIHSIALKISTNFRPGWTCILFILGCGLLFGLICSLISPLFRRKK